jgi:hypothetical protein
MLSVDGTQPFRRRILPWPFRTQKYSFMSHVVEFVTLLDEIGEITSLADTVILGHRQWDIERPLK